MGELYRRLLSGFAAVGLLVCLGQFENPDVDTYVLTEDNLILKQPAILEYSPVQVADAVLGPEDSELVPAPLELNLKPLQDENGREPASPAETAWSLHKLGTKRKVKVLFASSDLRGIEQPNEPQILRRREVQIDSDHILTLLNELPHDASVLANVPAEERTIALNLFEDTLLEAVIDQVKPSLNGGFSVQGRVAGVDGSAFHLVQENGITMANIFSDRVTYEVRYAGATHVINQIDPTKYESDDLSHGRTDYVTAAEMAGDVEGGALAQAQPSSVASTAAVEPVVIDVLAAYTPGVRAASGGNAAMQALIQLALDQANAGYSNSQINQRLRLAGTVEVEVNESQSASSDLSALAKAGDGKWDIVHSKRLQLGADVVHLLSANLQSGSCGIGYVGVKKAYAFSMSKASCISNHSFTHEIAHTLGANHDRGHAAESGGSAFGYVDRAAGIRTIMSYPVGNTVRVNYFSNPKVTYKGIPVGNASADNAAALSANALTVAAFSSAKPSSAVAAPAVAGVQLRGPASSAPAQAADTECSVRVESPNGGETLSESVGERVLWQALNAGENVRIKLVKGDQDLGTLTRSRNDGSILVRIPSLVDPGSGYRIRIESVDDPSCFDESDGEFSLVP